MHGRVSSVHYYTSAKGDGRCRTGLMIKRNATESDS
jgi:hypothetical protein